MIRVEQLRKSYGDVEAVRNVTFEAFPGQVIGLVGPNGAGKTTTIRMLCGIIPPDAGRVTVADRDMLREPVEAKRRLAYIPDEPRLFDALSVSEHLRLMGRLYDVVNTKQRAEELLEFLELTDKANELPGALSRGMKQKVAIACGLIHNPAVLIFDEPLTGLDPFAIRKLKDLMRQRAASGTTVLLSSHLLGLVEELADRVVVIAKGRKLADGSLDELRAALPALEGRGLEDIFLHVAAERAEA